MVSSLIHKDDTFYLLKKNVLQMTKKQSYLQKKRTTNYTKEKKENYNKRQIRTTKELFYEKAAF